jgi:RNA polymerase sigma factor (sigma-70 family)
VRPLAHEKYDERYDREDGRAMQLEHVGGLVRAAAEGDKAAWNALVMRFSGLVWSVARAYRLSAADAEDVFQTTWLRLMEHIGQIKDPDRVAGWLATTARNEALKALHANRRASPLGDLDSLDSLGAGVDDASPESVALATEEEIEQADRARSMWSALNMLSERCRRLLRVLMASPPPSYAEVAAALGMAVGSIGPTRARCLENLRRAIARSATPEVSP